MSETKKTGSVAPVAVLVLAAGASTRMGRPKQILPFQGSTLLRRVVEQALQSSASRVFVVLGAHAAVVAPTLDELPVEIIWNLDWEEGQGASIRTGVRFLMDRAPETGAVLFLLGDQPLVMSSSIERLIAVHRRTGAGLVASEQDGRLGVPALFSSRFFGELARLQGDAGGAHRLLREHEDEAVGLILPDAELDVDTPADYERLMAAS
ncbi:MAG TPA: nucleotidyltransferase family protein [Thermoanaerobaculia bacterium]|jgi:molybdenum cofactor cytidylyltransferase